MVDRQLELLRGGHPGDRGQVGDRPRQAVAGADRGGAGSLPVRHGRRADLRALPQPDGAEALVHARLRGDRQEPRAPLSRDGLVTAARADRGVHELPAVPAVRRRAAQARGARGHDRREEHPRVLEDVRHAGDRVPRLARADADRGADRRADHQGDPRAADVPRQRRRRLPAARSRGGDALRRRGAAAAARDADRLAARGRALHPRRAVDRAPPARQREADRDARAAARPRQHRGRRRARRADDARGRPPRGHGARRRRARRVRRGRGHGRGGRAEHEVGHGPVPLGQAGDRGSRAAQPRTRARSGCAARRSTT